MRQHHAVRQHEAEMAQISEARERLKHAIN